MLKATALSLAATVSLGCAASAESPAEFYQNRQITWIISAGAGGGYSAYARTFAPYFSKHIPGSPEIVIQNMPGAGGIRASVYLANVAPKDGSTIGLVHSSVPFAPLYGIKGAAFDPRKMHWIGSITTSSAICVAWHESGVREWKDLFKDGKYVVGGTGAGSQMETMPAMLNDLFGTKIKIISGYKGGNDVYLAMERGEVNGRCGGLISSIRSTRPEWFSKKKVYVPIQIAMKRNPFLPDSPAISEFIKDDRTKQILRLALSPMEMDRPILAPPDTPEDRVAALRKGFEAAVRDPGFLADAQKQHLEVDPVSGEAVAEVIKDAYSMPPEVVAAAKKAMDPSE